VYFWIRVRFSISAAATVSLLLTGCAGAGGSTASTFPAERAFSHRAPLTLEQRIAQSNSLGFVPVRNLNRKKSWMLPGAAKKWLIYVSDGSSGAVDVYDYHSKTGKLYGQMTGFSFPYGQCVDGAGNVYVTDDGTGLISEFAHGDPTPVATVRDTYGHPTGCSVDPKNGDFAMANFDSWTSGTGSVVIAAGGLLGKQTDLTAPDMFRAFPPAYDPNGNLFVQSISYSGIADFFELPAGKKEFEPLTGLSIGFPGSVQWDGHYLAATDQDYQFNYTTEIYRITVSKDTVTIVRGTELTDTCYPDRNWMVAIQPFVTGTAKEQNVVVAGNLNCPNRVGYWSYSKGGDPKRTIDPSIAPKSAYGQVVSPPGP
jgi:hypothetical protein